MLATAALLLCSQQLLIAVLCLYGCWDGRLSSMFQAINNLYLICKWHRAHKNGAAKGQRRLLITGHFQPSSCAIILCNHFTPIKSYLVSDPE